MTIHTAVASWVVPTQRAVWIPEGVPHAVAMSGAVAMRTLYLKPQLAHTLPRDCCVVNIPPLLRELIVHACALGSLNAKLPRQRHIIDIILDQLQAIRVVPLQLPSPSDPRALRVAEALAAQPGNRQPLAGICKKSGASKRTIERLFDLECNMTFGRWRQQLRLMHALRLLGQGEKVTTAAVESGYSTPSAFIAAFRKALGATPGVYFETRRRRTRDSM